jgi:hypothetical protein
MILTCVHQATFLTYADPAERISQVNRKVMQWVLCGI